MRLLIGSFKKRKPQALDGGWGWWRSVRDQINDIGLKMMGYSDGFDVLINRYYSYSITINNKAGAWMAGT